MDTTNPTNPTTTSASGSILTLDLGKDKRAASLYERASATARFAPLGTTREELRRPLERHRPAPEQGCSALLLLLHDLGNDRRLLA
jgi:hypothetical protein